MQEYKSAIVACARWENADLSEWIEYHKALGFDHIYLYCNDDDPAPMRKILSPYLRGAKPYVSFYHWPFKGQQLSIYINFLESYAASSEWISFLDVDEFITLKKHRGISEFLHSFEDKFDCIYFNWLIYGNNGRLSRDEELDILPCYTRRSASVNCHTKNIFRRSCVSVALIRVAFERGALGFWHFWDNYPFNMRICDVLGNTIMNYAHDFPSNAIAYVSEAGYSENCINTAYVAHFQFKSEGDFLRRYHRGGFENGKTWEKDFKTGIYKKRLEACNVTSDTFLAKFWHDHIFTNQRTLPDYAYLGDHLVNVALFKPTEQSSVYQAEAGDAPNSHSRDHGNDGCRTGGYGFHTKQETTPWWSIDLLYRYDISEIHIYNRVDDPACSNRIIGLKVQLSDDGFQWRTVHVIEELGDFVWSREKPLVVSGNNFTAQFLRLMLSAVGILHLDEVEVYGALG